MSTGSCIGFKRGLEFEIHYKTIPLRNSNSRIGKHLWHLGSGFRYCLCASTNMNNYVKKEYPDVM